jgi:type IX secretion system PorP/SprF family membrane protein
MLKIVKLIIFFFVYFYISNVTAQQESSLTFINYHMNLLNPAFSGIDNETSIKTSLRKQWSGVQFAPETQAISFSTPLGRNLSLGLSIVNDKTFIEKDAFVGVDLSYKLQLDRLSNLYFGLKIGGSNYNVNVDGLETYSINSDPALSSISTFNPNIGLGFLYKREKFYVSLSIPKLLSTTRAKNNEGYASLFSDAPHSYLGAGCDFNLDEYEAFTLKPSILFRYVNGLPLTVDFNTMVDYSNKFELGFLYRTSKIAAFKTLFKISNRLNLGYGYEIGTAQLASAGNSNEFFLQFKF